MDDYTIASTLVFILAAGMLFLFVVAVSTWHKDITNEYNAKMELERERAARHKVDFDVNFDDMTVKSRLYTKKKKELVVHEEPICVD